MEYGVLRTYSVYCSPILMPWFCPAVVLNPNHDHPCVFHHCQFHRCSLSCDLAQAYRTPPQAYLKPISGVLRDLARGVSWWLVRDIAGQEARGRFGNELGGIGESILKLQRSYRSNETVNKICSKERNGWRNHMWQVWLIFFVRRLHTNCRYLPRLLRTVLVHSMPRPRDRGKAGAMPKLGRRT